MSYPEPVPQTQGFWLMALALPLFMAASVAPSPLYVVYQDRWHFTAATLTVIYAVYMGPLVFALLTIGGLSDEVGRRPILVISLAMQALSMVVFMTATGVASLIAARLIQGLAAGAAIGAVTSGMLDLAPAHRQHLGALLNGITPAIGIGTGAAVSGLLVQFAPAPTVTVYVLLAVCFAGLAIAVAVRVETSPGSTRSLSLRPRITVPTIARAAFLMLLPGVIASAALGGFYNSLSGSIALHVLGEPNKTVAGFAIMVLQVAAVATSVTAAQRLRSTRLVASGSLVLVVGLTVLTLSLGTGTPWVFFVGTGLSGAGYGAIYLGAIRTLATLAPQGRRAELFAALNVVNYLSLSVPTILAGVLATHVGLRVTAISFVLVLLILAAASAVAQLVHERHESARRSDTSDTSSAPRRGLTNEI